MKNQTVTIHHLGFYWPNEQAAYGKTTLSIDTDATGDMVAEMAFDVTNNPSKTPNILSREGRCPTLSVGDIVENKETNEYFLCVSDGWIKIARSEVAYLASKVEQAAENGKRYDVGNDGPKNLKSRRERQEKNL